MRASERHASLPLGHVLSAEPKEVETIVRLFVLVHLVSGVRSNGSARAGVAPPRAGRAHLDDSSAIHMTVPANAASSAESARRRGRRRRTMRGACPRFVTRINSACVNVTFRTSGVPLVTGRVYPRLYRESHVFLLLVHGRKLCGRQQTPSAGGPQEEEEREDAEPRCSFCDAPFPNIDA
ncbi:hypothetical protein EVAR_82897_1 [Eumeta japonica]|uniref:Uncharacterized protein n=1 Tax=Eumeta variegata TaxID=151549 RepID=A0A4C1YLC7_EUMVA|nr:hypothetical protein EVAR_82897_1 [Eumeta japonica]